MEDQEKEVIYVHRGSVELVVIGLLAALVVLLAFPLLSGIERKELKNIQENQLDSPTEELLPID